MSMPLPPRDQSPSHVSAVHWPALWEVLESVHAQELEQEKPSSGTLRQGVGHECGRAWR